MENEQWKCPICGASNNSEAKKVTRSLTMPYVPNKDVETFVWTCTTCKESGDFLIKNDVIIESALSSMEGNFIKETIHLFKTRGYSMPYLDRALSLPQGTMNAYYSGTFDKDAVALLRILRTFPWMVAVADGGFSPAISGTLVLRAASEVLAKHLAKMDEK